MSEKPQVTLLILRGLPGSGKSTFARSLIEKSKQIDPERIATGLLDWADPAYTPGKWKRINKDTLRDMLDMDEWSPRNEHLLNQVVQSLLFRYLKAGFNVVSDNMNFSSEHIKRAVEIANTINTENDSVRVNVAVKDFDTPLEVCIERDALRPAPITEPTIRGIHAKWLMRGFPDISQQLAKLLP